MSIGEGVPLGVIPHTLVVAPILDTAQVEEVVKGVENGNIPAMLTLVLHNQMVMSRKLNGILKEQQEQKYGPDSGNRVAGAPGGDGTDSDNADVSHASGETSKKPGRKASK